MTVKQMRAFLAVAQTLSFAAACERLHLSQSALSLTIKGLEEGLGGRLFSRNTRNVALTPEGESLLPLARRLIADWDNAEDELRQRFTLQRGRVTVAAMPSFAGNLLPPILKIFRARYPQVNVTVNDVINEQVLEMVRDRQVELGVAFEPSESSSLMFTPLYVDRFVAVVPGDSPLAHKADIDWQTLLQQPFITLQRPSTVRVMLEEHLKARDMKLPVALESHQLATVGQMVASGLGVSAVPALCVRQMQDAGAHCITLSDPIIERPIGVLTKPGHELSAAAQAMFDIFRDEAGKGRFPALLQ
ncbi:LysR family transcriptional regulator [Pseudomonas yamanorum]|jgi:LysR family carnitine catabolism transcriptional activator|uniref:LysR family transcriptional regulator n=1 Tax=Pseudomonas yamanorum TaxID=515393 RepID=A0A7Y8F966_9PSED|nr:MULTISPECIES: LysR family transcriptional regulator [Pseudomonas]MCS3419240.1 LysR family carnitine catabolism transcriptional activator [Pseudomonas sp. BIGb0558]MCS3439685.1 LysR family carnitine catabolism transcriptional activator [Pseudomonas sp. BIGb0450]NVZ81169.1 LysR family transcriptional regulator [Pseudomonas yamanorum]NWE39147.1 LysR family transcriptional regulator [Pseudomonas yamanorum]NWE74986.1 LysR family transcriptional regulator [Pseudomonas yamanorum]